MGDENEPAVDLLGDPWAPLRDRRGRKRHRRNAQVAEAVAVLKATGSTIEEICLRVGLTDKTLRKYYSGELDGGAATTRQLLIQKMWGMALNGNVSAAKFVREEMARGAAVHAQERRAPSEAKPGKKEQHLADARAVGGKFAPPDAPRLIVDNDS